jgi:hypothetical protein
MTLNDLIYEILRYVSENDRTDLLSRPILNIDIDKNSIYIQTNKDNETIILD